MGNACTINSSAVLASQRSSPFLSLTFPAQPEFPEDNTYQNKSGSLYQLNQANIQNSLLAYTTINNTKPSRRHVYTLNRRNLQKAIDSQEIDISLTDSTGNEEINAVLLPLPGLDKGEGDDYKRLQQKTWLFGKEGNNKEIMNIPSLFTDNNQEEVQISYRNTNYRKEQMEREEREKKIAEGLSRIFGGSHHIDFIRSSSLTRENKVPELTDKKDVFSKEGISLSDCSPFAGSAIPSVTNVEGDECSSGQTTTRRVKKALIESLMAKNESTLKKTDHSKSKSLINYCNEEVHEQNIMAELYEGVGAPQVKVEKKEETKPEPEKIEEKKLLTEKKCDVNLDTVASEKKDLVEKKYTSNKAPLSARKGAENVLCVTGSPTSEFLLSNRELRREKQLRNESFAERLMESMLEDRPDEKEGRLGTIGASGEKCPLPLLRRNLFDSERKSYRGNVYESNGKDKQEPYVRGFESINYALKEETKVVENKEVEQKFQTPTKKVDSLNKENRQSVSPKMNSAAKGFVSVTELLDAGENVGVKEEPVVVPVVMKEESSVKLVMRMEPVEEVLNEKKTILQEVEDLQKEVFEKMSHVTSSLKTTGTLNPDKILELKEIQDKLQMLTRLVNTGGDTTKKSSGSTHNNTPINQLRVENFNAEHTREIGVVDNNFCSPIPADGSFTIKPYDIKPIPIPKIFDVDLSEIMKKKKPGHTQSRLATEADSSIMKPSQYPVESRTTLEFFDTEMDCHQNPKEMWTKQVDLKSVKTLSELDQSGVSHRAATGQHKERRTSSHKRHSENSSQLYKQVAVEANPVNFQHMIRKLSYPKNLSTYNQPQLSQRESHSKGRASVGNYPVKNVKGSVTERSQSPISARTTVKQDPLSRRQSGTVTKKPLERRSSNSQNAMCSRKPSVEKMKTCNVEMKPSVSPTMTRDMSREKIVQGRMSVGSHDVNKGGLSKGVNSRKGTMERSVGSGKGRKSSTVTQYRRESTEPCQEGDLFEVNYDTNKAGMLYEEITRLNQKLAENRSHLKTMTTMTEPNEPDSGTLSQRNRISKMLQDRGNKEGAYSARARKRMEYSNPATARAGYQNTEQSLVSDRRHTGNYEFQPEQNGGYIATEPSSHVESKREQAIRMRTKMIEEIARRQSLMEDSEWALNRNIPTIQVVKALSRNGIKNLM